MKILFSLLFVFCFSASNAQFDPDYNKALSDTIKTWQGVEYYFVERGKGEKPEKGDKIYVRYKGYLENGQVFDSSANVPFSFRYDKMEVIKGWDIIFGYLKDGDKARVFIPYKFAYGRQGNLPVIPRKADLIFDIEIVGIQKM